jgi:AcrR family transcriptional regulator
MDSWRISLEMNNVQKNSLILNNGQYIFGSMGRRADHSRDELHDLAIAAARHIVEADGYRGLTVRGVAERMGYAAGTLYNLFDNFDELVFTLRAETLDELYGRLSRPARTKATPEANLLGLALGYIAFAREHPKLWNLHFEHSLPADQAIPAWYHEKASRMLDLVERALGPLFPSARKKSREHHAQVLWAGVHGICAVQLNNKLVEKSDCAEAMVRSLIRNYVNGLQRTAGRRN